MYIYVLVPKSQFKKRLPKRCGIYRVKVEMQKKKDAFPKVIPPSCRPIFQGGGFVRAIYCAKRKGMRLREVVIMVAIGGCSSQLNRAAHRTIPSLHSRKAIALYKMHKLTMVMLA